MSKGIELTSKYWGIHQSSAIKAWSSHPIIKREINRRISGSEDVSWIEYIKKEYFTEPSKFALSLASGFGGLERYLVTKKIVDRIEGIDISSGAIKAAIDASSREGLGGVISYKVEDLNKLKLSPGLYQSIWNISASHHVNNLDNLFSECAKALTSDGILITNEYIGPRQFRVPDNVVDIINQILQILPEKYRKNLGEGGPQFIGKFQPPLAAWFEKYDPSEAIRSDEIILIMRKYFKIEMYRPYGGAILHFLLSGLAGNFNEAEDPVCIIKMLILIEGLLEKAGYIQSDHALIVARPIR
jgi:SAM-dependent methyltransferase